MIRFLFGPLIIAAGIFIMKYNVQITNFSGKFDFAEKYLGSGIGAGTYTFYRLFGLACCVLAVLWMFKVINFTPNF